MSGNEDADESRRRFQAPYTGHHPIPTISKYREEKEARKAAAGRDGVPHEEEQDLGRTRTQRAREGWNTYWYGDKDGQKQNEQKDSSGGADQQTQQGVDVDGDGDVDQDDQNQAEIVKDTSEVTPVADPKKRRKGAGRKEERAEREVTDPVTHLPVRIYDFTEDSLKNVEENPPPFGSTSRTATGLSNKNKSQQQIQDEQKEIQGGLDAMNTLFPPPSYDVIRQDIITINKQGITIGMAGGSAIILGAFGLERILRPHVARLLGSGDQGHSYIGISLWSVLGFLTCGSMWYLIQGVREWMANRIDDTWEDQVWEANLQSRERAAKAHETEPVTWLNQLLGSVWPLINPDLFTSLADTLEDVMQASLPKLVQMVSVEDIGQGSEALRILGVRWLPTGAAARSTGDDGSLKSADESKKNNDRTVPGEGEVDEDAGPKDDDNQQDQENEGEDGNGDGSERAQVAEGMEAEEGDFINLEVAFAYRARASKSFKDRTKDLHFYIAFYLPGNIKVPVWVDCKGIVGSCRLRLQLTPDPPFFALCTLTFLGQPKVDISCIPLVKHGLNIMDLPLISNFVQGSVDAAMAEYVAPKSLTLDLKDMLAGDDFKKDTAARGIIVVYIKRGYDFKMGDASVPLISDGSSDPYVSVGWAKFGKPLFSTRVLISEMEPYWNERAVLLVTPEELNVDERLRLQLWDSDRFTADDDLGRIEVDLKEIMKSDKTNGKMCDRTDGFRALKAGENMPGKLEWSVGYFSKTRLQPCQFKKQDYDSSIRSMEDLERTVDEKCQRKLREAMIKKGRHSRDGEELEQQKQQEMKEQENAIVISAPPPDNYPSGIFSIQIHQITGLELDDVRGKADQGSGPDGEETESGPGLPSAYCNIIINHKKVFKTRTKPKNSKPFYNAGTERFIADWHNAEVFVAVRDARVDEEDPLLGVVHLPLSEVFKERAQVNGFYPIAGGLGFGRVRISMVWRSVQLQAPSEALAWDYGTLEIKPTITSSDLPDDIKDLKIKLHSSLARGKMHRRHGETDTSGALEWHTRKGKSLYLPFQDRYASCLAIRFKKNGMFKDKTAAFCIFWLKDIPDEEEKELELPIYKGNFERARANCLEEPGEKVGSLKVTLKFWSGLSERHSKLANRDPNMRNVMEVLDVARDNYESMQEERDAGIVEADGDENVDDDDEDDADDDDTNSDSDDSEDEDDDANSKNEAGSSKQNNKTDLIDKAKDYKKHSKQQHRRNRGVMQYKLPRTVNWASNKAQRVESKVSGIFRRHTRQPGIETEV